MNTDLCSLCAALLIVPAAILGWMNIADRIRIRRVRLQYRSLSSESRQQMLRCIDEAGRAGSNCTVLVAAEVASPTSNAAVIESHYGGMPYAEAGDVWPTVAEDKTEPADFLIQVRLDDTFPSPWSGRLIVIFSRREIDQTVRCYATPACERWTALANGPTPQREWLLNKVLIPKQPGLEEVGMTRSRHGRDGYLDYDPVVLVDTLPQLNTELLAHTKRPADLLAAVLAPNHCGYGFELSHLVQLGGDPVWLHADLEGLDCEHCHRPMRFLFQFGDLNGGSVFDDGGVCYVFGCDNHPDQPRGIVQVP
ncbi:MAG: hypothetical protein JSS49_26800 [Planctomycetes bacterium]|nr:hypothetical protein [Planctomycetota bacterium]